MASTVVQLDISRCEASHEDFSLKRIQRGEHDKLGNKILEILWLSPDYAVYRTASGVFIHFSDDKQKEVEQRAAFTTICAELCELRFLTSEMRVKRWRLPGLSGRRSPEMQGGDPDHLIFNHNIAQSLMLLMEGKTDDAKAITTAALDMAVARVTNDNTIRYLVWALSWAAAVIGALGIFHFLVELVPIKGLSDQSPMFLIAWFYGVVGACFSIITRMQSFEMKPCQQSNMNKWMALIRIMIGLIGGFAFYLWAKSSLGSALVNEKTISGWQGAALIGFIGGFAERLVQSVFQRTATGLEGKTGTPVQRARVKPAR